MKRFVLIMAAAWIAAGAAAETRLGVHGTLFTIDDRETFLLGISYYGGLGAPEEFVAHDLDDMKKAGFNWIRLWAVWSTPDHCVLAIDREGSAREPHFSKLRRIIEECDRRGMIVDVTISRSWGGADGMDESLTSAALVRAAETLARELAPYRNWYLDMGNERNIGDRRQVSIAELRKMRDAVKAIDPARLVTGSHAGDMTREELRGYLFDVKVDFVAPHRPRDPDSPSKTKRETTRMFEWMQASGRIVPVHYQEPFRRGYDPGHFEPRAADFATDLKGALEGGAAGWCLHNGSQKNAPEEKPRRSFDLREVRLFDALDDEEKKFIRQAGEIVRTATR